MSATLGGLIKDYRLQRNIPQLDIAYKIGWKDATILSRIEQGVTKNPTREVVDKICEAIGLEEEEKNYLLLIGGYLPTWEEIQEIRKKTDPIINEWKYPANVYDFSWRLIHENKASTLIHYFSDEVAKKYANIPTNAVELNFSSDYLQTFRSIETVHNDQFLIGIIAQFLEDHRNRSHQRWYIELMKKMMEISKFREIYQQALKAPKQKLVLEYAYVEVLHRNLPKNELLKFHMFNAPLLSDRRIFIEFLVPASIETFKYYEENKY